MFARCPGVEVTPLLEAIPRDYEKMWQGIKGTKHLLCILNGTQMQKRLGYVP